MKGKKSLKKLLLLRAEKKASKGKKCSDMFQFLLAELKLSCRCAVINHAFLISEVCTQKDLTCVAIDLRWNEDQKRIVDTHLIFPDEIRCEHGDCVYPGSQVLTRNPFFEDYFTFQQSLTYIAETILTVHAIRNMIYRTCLRNLHQKYAVVVLGTTQEII